MTNSTRYVGITGFMSRAEVDACRDVLPEGLTLMCGVLASPKSLACVRNKWHRRYPAPEDIAGIFSDDPRCLNLIHYSTSDAPPNAATVSRLQTVGGPRCHGFQFNGVWPEPSTLAALAGGHVVLQVRPDGKGSAAEALDRLHGAARALANCAVHVLIDASGGRGLPINEDIADAWAMAIRGRFGNDVGIGFAGGLDAESLRRIASKVQRWGASTDTEGRVRDGDEGGTLSLDKARAYLRAAGEVMTPIGGGDRSVLREWHDALDDIVSDNGLAKLVRERLASHRANLAGWREPDGRLVPTEPEPKERERIRDQLRAVIHELEILLARARK